LSNTDGKTRHPEPFDLKILVFLRRGIMNINIPLLRATSVLAAALWIGSAAAGPLADGPSRNSDGLPAPAVNVGGAVDDAAPSADLPAEMQRQIALFRTRFPRGTAVIHTAHTYLCYVLGDDRTIRYGIGVGRDGFTSSGEQTVTRKAEWPDWTPPAEIERQRYLPSWMAGGYGNPFGDRAPWVGS
jgi:lipoprotein-anchoring transpeptidase ErfK/SrfK